MAHKQRTWWVVIPGRPPFSMVHMEGELDKREALAIARSIWPNCNLKMRDR